MPLVRIAKLVTGGQGMGELADGRKVFVWGVLPDEEVELDIIRDKKSFAEGVVLRIVKPSPDRIEPYDADYLAHSPWQIMTVAAENQAKIDIVREQFAREHLLTSKIPSSITATEDDGYGYRNKMEYTFIQRDSGELMLATTQRNSHDKNPTAGSALALASINTAAHEILSQLRELGATACDLDSLVLRANQQGRVVAALYINHPRYKKLSLPVSLKGLEVYFHNPRQRTRRGAKRLQKLGEDVLTDTLLGSTFTYDVHSFFQVNVPIYEKALRHIQAQLPDGAVVDMYAGVGSIGLSAAKGHITLVEIDSASVAMARRNAQDANAEVVESSAERALEHIRSDVTVIFDPPRAGLQRKVIERCLEAKPQQIVYLSCDPATLARDLVLLSTDYDIADVTLYNFFPRTPHIETLVMLEVKDKR